MADDIIKTMAGLGINPLDYEDIFRLVDQHHDELLEIMNQCDQWVPKADGIPALLILDDFTNSGSASSIPPAGEYVTGGEYAQMALALAILFQKYKPDEIYPSICPAMSAVLQWKFTKSPYNACLQYMDPSIKGSEG
jgi:hypothetical protein